jgi:hypothetical protein
LGKIDGVNKITWNKVFMWLWKLSNEVVPLPRR